MRTTSLTARLVVCMDRPPIEAGVVTLAGEYIAEVTTRPQRGGPLEDLGDVALLPGFINAHTHLEFSDLRRPLGAPGMRLVDWIRLVIARRSGQQAPPRQAIASGMEELLRGGATTVCDITTANGCVYPAHAAGPAVVGLLEAIGYSKSRAASALAAIEQRLRQSRAAVISGLPRSEQLAIGLSPHAPYSVHPRLLENLVRLANRDRLPVAMHLAESREELELLETGSGAFRELLQERGMWDAAAIERGTRPLAYLNSLSRAPRALVIHGTHLKADEMRFLAAHRERMTLVYCPRTHSYFSDDRYPLTAALKEGASVAIGTDSRASTPDLGLLGDLRHAARQHPDVSPDRLLQMATLAAAEAIGIANDVGSITPGKLANLTAVPLDPAPGLSAAEAILASGAAPIATWYRGTKVAAAGVPATDSP